MNGHNKLLAPHPKIETRIEYGKEQNSGFAFQKGFGHAIQQDDSEKEKINPFFGAN
jgi:hypothetical protein